MGTKQADGHDIEHFSVVFLLSTSALTLLSLFAVVWLFFPGVWEKQLSASITAIALTFLAVHFVNAFVEYFVHRYVLHMPVFPFLSHFYQQHTLHHALTDVTPKGELVSNEYPIEKEHQHKASFMPWYSYYVFALFYTPLFTLVYILFPEVPIFLAGFAALSFSLMFYELLHAALHLPMSTWNRLFAKPYVGIFWKRLYKHHLRHHVDIRTNEAVFGFFGFPLADIVFGTYLVPNTLYDDKSDAAQHTFGAKRPYLPIRLLDSLFFSFAKKRLQQGRQQAQSVNGVVEVQQ